MTSDNHSRIWQREDPSITSVRDRHQWIASLPIKESAYGFLKRLRFIERSVSDVSRDRPIESIHVLEVGCGTGTHISIPLARLGLQVTGIDIHEESIRHAQTAGAAYPNVRFQTRFVQDVSSQAYDVVICSEVLEHIREFPSFFAQVTRTLKPNGVLVVTVPNGHGPFEKQKWLWKTVVAGTWLEKFLRAAYRIKVQGNRPPSAFLNKDSGHVNFFRRHEVEDLFRANNLVLERYEGRTFLCGWMVDPLMDVPALAQINSWLGSRLPSRLVSDWMFSLRAPG